MWSMNPVTTSMAIVGMCVMIDLLGNTMTSPINSNFAREVQGSSGECPTNVGDANYTALFNSAKCQDFQNDVNAKTGYLKTFYAAAMLISNGWMPLFSDKFGRRPTVILSIAGSCMGFLGQGLTCAIGDGDCVGIPGGFPFLVAVRFFGGLFGGTMSVAAAFVVDLYPKSKRNEIFSKLGASALCSAIFGPFIGGGLAQFGLRIPLYAAATLSALALGLAIVYIEETSVILASIEADAREQSPAAGKFMEAPRQSDETRPAIAESSSGSPDLHHQAFVRRTSSSFFPTSPRGRKKPVKQPSLWDQWREKAMAALSVFLQFAGFYGMVALMPLILLDERLGVVAATDSVETQGKQVALWVMLFLPTMGVIQAVVLLKLYPLVHPRLGMLATGSLGCLLVFMGVTAMAFWEQPGYFFFSIVFIAVGAGLASNVPKVYLSGLAAKGKEAQTLAIAESAKTCGCIVGPFVTQLYSADGDTLSRSIPFIVAGAFPLLGSVSWLLLSIYDAQRSSNQPELDKTSGMELSSVTVRGAACSSSITAETEACLAKRVHPALHFTGKKRFGHGPNASVEVAELGHYMFQQLCEKNHMYGLEDSNPKVRRAMVTLIKGLVKEAIPTLQVPDKATGYLEYRQDIAQMCLSQGRTEWAEVVQSPMLI